ncbi:hypothetical protein CQW23_04259 [Capsicum baccatum]|uniref:Peptidase S8/S53 domain-containing protein n=1 Tax=Capsicum baccatum TaxID=33114 RepID=A0A2G2XE48_CAPBA|nr:hypothetical protein CQW23_04259 [Capsicum baccatum]
MKPGFVSAHPQRVLELDTHTPSKGVMISLLDSGITPKQPSFSDNGTPPPPAKWKDKCDLHLCGEGHGTHTSSTDAGNFVEGTNFLVNANGTAVGIAPHAHLAMYKVCGAGGCPEAFILAGLDASIEDGVDVISASLGASSRNRGLAVGTVRNGAPWILTVGASITDRKIGAVAVLGNGEKYEGEPSFQPTNFSGRLLPLVNAKDCESSPKIDIKGEIVLYNISGDLSRIKKGVMKNVGAAAMILMNNKEGGYTTFQMFMSFQQHMSVTLTNKKIINYRCYVTPRNLIPRRHTVLKVELSSCCLVLGLKSISLDVLSTPSLERPFCIHTGATGLGNKEYSKKFRSYSASSPALSNAINSDSIIERAINVCLDDF